MYKTITTSTSTTTTTTTTTTIHTRSAGGMLRVLRALWARLPVAADLATVLSLLIQVVGK